MRKQFRKTAEVYERKATAMSLSYALSQKRKHAPENGKAKGNNGEVPMDVNGNTEPPQEDMETNSPDQCSR